MPAPAAFATAKQLADFSGGAIAEDDPRVESLLAAASSAIRRFCGWHVFPVQWETVTVDGSGGRVQQLPTLRLVSVTTVSECGEVVEDTSFGWSADGSLRKRHGVWTDEYRGVEAAIEHGFDDCPDLVTLALQVAARAAVSPTGLTREAVGGMQYGYSTLNGSSGGVAFFAHEIDILNQYRLVGA